MPRLNRLGFLSLSAAAAASASLPSLLLEPCTATRPGTFRFIYFTPRLSLKPLAHPRSAPSPAITQSPRR